MMIKKRIFFGFLIVLLVSLFINVPPLDNVKADSNVTVSFELLVDNKSVVLANKDDVVNVDFIIKRTDANSNYSTSGFQNEIYYDMEAFEFVEDSIVLYDTGMASAKLQDNIEHGKIIQCANMGNTYAPVFKFCSFKLKAKKDNVNAMVYNSNLKMFDVQNNPIPFTDKNLRVMVGIDCEHTTKSTFAKVNSTCISEGHEAYLECTVCDALFNDDNELIAEVPSLPLSGHTGGVATCKQKAVCMVCNAEYGSINANNHDGEITLENYVGATSSQEGYSGDDVCTDCGKVVEKGVVIPRTATGGNINITINGNNNVVGENNAVSVGNNDTINTKSGNEVILIIGFSVISVLLLITVIVLIMIYAKVKETKKEDKVNKVEETTSPIIPIMPITNSATNASSEQQLTTQPIVVNEPIAPIKAETAITLDDSASVSNVQAPIKTEKEATIIKEPIIENDTTDTLPDSTEVVDDAEDGFENIVKKPFETKLNEATESVKNYYNELKALLLSYKKVKSRISIKFDSVYVGRQQLAKFVIRGKSLYLYLALNADDFVDTKYNVLNTTAKSYVATPCKYKVNGERKLAWAKELILELAKKCELIKL